MKTKNNSVISLCNFYEVPFGINLNKILIDSKQNLDCLKENIYDSNENQNSNSGLKQPHWYIVLTQINFYK